MNFIKTFDERIISCRPEWKILKIVVCPVKITLRFYYLKFLVFLVSSNKQNKKKNYLN